MTTAANIIKGYIDLIKSGQEPTNPDDYIYQSLKMIYDLGAGDFKRGVKTWVVKNTLSPLELSVLENIVLPDAETSPVTAALLDMPQTEYGEILRKLLPEIAKQSGKLLRAGREKTAIDQPRQAKSEKTESVKVILDTKDASILPVLPTPTENTKSELLPATTQIKNVNINIQGNNNGNIVVGDDNKIEN